MTELTDAEFLAIEGSAYDDPGVTERFRKIAAKLREVESVLSELDHLAEVWGDEGAFRRCRDRLREVVR